jgi:hypothetical protein
LKAVALLGAETPGVGNLKPLHEVVEFSDETWGSLHAYTVQPQRRAPMTLKTLADCTARLAALKTEIAEEQDAEKREVLYAEQSDVTDKLVEFSAKSSESNDDDDDDKSKGPDALDFKTMQDRMAEMETELADSRENTRAAKVEVKVNNLRVPALRDHVAALYDLASQSDSKVRFFTAEVDGEKKYGEVDPTKVVDDLVDRINKSTEKLFTTLGTSGDFKRDDEPATDNSIDAGSELDRLTKAYMVKNDIKDAQYAKAFTIVLDDPENASLKKLYAEAG